jgi:hypothetical protein
LILNGLPIAELPTPHLGYLLEIQIQIVSAMFPVYISA